MHSNSINQLLRTLIGLATGHLTEAIILVVHYKLLHLLGLTLGAAVAPDAALASVASAIIYIKGNDFSEAGQSQRLVQQLL